MQQRQQSLHNLINIRIQNLRSAIRAGVDVRHDPAYVQEYLQIVGLFGEGIFAFEDQSMQNGFLTKETQQE